MSQESNTESNSGDKPKKRLSLKKGGGGGSPAPAQPAPEPPKPQASSSSEKPFRMSFKKKEEDAASTPAASEAPAPEPAAPEPPEAEAPPVKLGLKKTPKPEESAPPPVATPPPPVTPQVPTPPPTVKKVPIVEAGSSASGEDLSKPAPGPAVPPPPSMKRTPEEKPRGHGPGTRPPIPPPGMKVRKDDEAESDVSSLPPPVSPLGNTPPPILPTTDLMEEEFEAEKAGKSSPLKGIFVAAIILLFLVGGIGTIVWGVMGMLKGGEGTAEEALVRPPPVAITPTEPAEPAPSGPKLATDEPKSFLGKTALLTQQVSEKASTEEITDFAEELENQAAPEESPEVVKASNNGSTPGITRDVEPTPVAVRSTGDPEVRAWIEGIRPSGVGRGMMILDGEKYRLGEVVNPQLNIRWVGVDSQLGILIFEDPYGVRYEKDY